MFDEVQTGFGLTGTPWACQHWRRPDLVAFGKKTQVCGFMARRRVDEVRQRVHGQSRINSTWGGNLVDMVRCTRILEIIESDGLCCRRPRRDATSARARGPRPQLPGVVSMSAAADSCARSTCPAPLRATN